MGRLKKLLRNNLFPDYMRYSEKAQLKVLRGRIFHLLPYDPAKQQVILVTSSSLSKAELGRQCEKLSEYINKDLAGLAMNGYQLIPVGSINESDDLFKFAQKADSCLIYEQQERSSYPLIERQLGQIKDLGLPVLGFVYLYQPC